MKDLVEQIKYLDTIILPIYGIKSIVDYETEISVSTLKEDPELLTKLDKEVPNIKKTFPVREFSFHKTNNQVRTHKQAFSMLQKCLLLTNVLHDIINRKNILNLRLISENIILTRYIENKNKMTEFRQIVEDVSSDTEKGDEQLIVRNNETQWLKNRPGKQVMFTEEEYLDSVIDKGEVVNFKVPLSSFFANNKKIDSNTSNTLRHNIKNIRINAEPFDDVIIEVVEDVANPLNAAATNVLLNRMKKDASYTISIGGANFFSGEFEFGKDLIPPNVYLPVSYLMYQNLELWIDLPESLTTFLNDKLVLGVDLDVFNFKPKIRRKLQHPNSQYKISLTDSNNKPNFMLYTNGTLTLQYDTSSTESLLKKGGKYVLSEGVTTTDYQIGEFACRHIKGEDKNGRDCSMNLAFYVLQEDGVDIVSIDHYQTYPIISYQEDPKSSEVVFSVDLRHCGDTKSDLEIRFPQNDIQNPTFKLVYSDHNQRLEEHDLDYTVAANNVYIINRYTSEHMLHAYRYLITSIEIRIKKEEFKNPNNEIEISNIEYYWKSSHRAELFQYHKTYDFIEYLEDKKAIRIWQNRMRILEGWRKPKRVKEDKSDERSDEKSDDDTEIRRKRSPQRRVVRRNNRYSKRGRARGIQAP